MIIVSVILKGGYRAMSHLIWYDGSKKCEKKKVFTLDWAKSVDHHKKGLHFLVAKILV